MSWATQFPDTIWIPLNDAFTWSDSKEGGDYWAEIYKGNIPQPKQAPKVNTPKVLAFEDELKRRLDARRATNAKNKAIHDKALELAEASRKKLEKKLKKLMVANWVVSDVE